MEMIVHVRWYGLFYLILSFVTVFTGMCGSRKYPYPCHSRSLKIPRGGGFKGSNFQGEGGGSWETTFPKGDEPRTKH